MHSFYIRIFTLHMLNTSHPQPFNDNHINPEIGDTQQRTWIINGQISVVNKPRCDTKATKTFSHDGIDKMADLSVLRRQPLL